MTGSAEGSSTFEAHVERTGACTELSLVGEMDIAHRDALSHLCGDQVGVSVLIRLDQLSFLDVAGARALRQLILRLRRQQCEIGVVGATPSVLRVCELLDVSLPGPPSPDDGVARTFSGGLSPPAAGGDD